MLTDLQLAVVVAGLAAHAIIAYYVFYRRRTNAAASGTADGGTTSRTPADDVVECPNCGTENDDFYRYCRTCVAELPGTTPFVDTAGHPLGGTTR